MEKNGCVQVIKDAISQNRPAPSDIVPDTVVRHFLYKSRANVQFTMSSYAPEFASVSRRRGLVPRFHSCFPCPKILIDPLG